MASNNLFTGAANETGGGSTASRLKAYLGNSGLVVTRYPSAIAANSGIPYVVFAPYVRSIDHALQSLEYNKVLDDLDAPKFAIVLPLPSSALSTNYGVQYDQIDLGTTVGSIGTGMKGIADAVFNKAGEDTLTQAASVTTEVLTSVVSVAGVAAYQAVVGAVEAIPGVGQGASVAFQKYLGLAENPFTETLFKNVALRTHTFDYTFLPKTLDESKTVDEIIQLFKFYMLPASGQTTALQGFTSLSGSFFSFPYEFQILYSVADTTFTLMPSVLEDMSVNYSDGAHPSFFVPDARDKRYPTKITMSLKFKEVVMLTRDRVQVNNTTSPDYSDESKKNITRFHF